MQYFYDANIRRYLLQFVRIFGNFTIQKGYDEQGNPIYEKVPARYGDISRQAAHILKENSENTLNTVPFISCYVSDLEMNPDLRRYPQFEETLHVIEKSFDENTHTYTNDPGKSYNVTRYQPVPYMLTMNVDIWTSNTDQKLQILEQILVLFNPGINLHTNQNVLDWTSLTYCELTNTNWSSRSLPSGTDTIIDISTLTFKMPIFINPPVKVQRMNIIQTILTQIHTLDAVDFETWTVNDITGPNSSFVVTTLENYQIRFVDGTALLLDRSGNDHGGDGSVLNWKKDVFSYYGELRPGISQLRLRQGGDITDPSNDVIGTIDYDLNNPQKLIVTIDTDTLPNNDLGTIDDVIDPQKRGPGSGLPPAAQGQRYLVLDDVPNGGIWGTVGDGSSPIANKNDIIIYNGSSWVVDFDSSANNGPNYVFDLDSGDQFEWTGTLWQHSYEGNYKPGWFRLYV